jgi:hypothetical protein
MLLIKEDGMVVAMHVFGILGAVLCAFASFWLAFRFGIRFGIMLKNNGAYVASGVDKFWEILGIHTPGRAQKINLYILTSGFISVLISQILSCLIQ